MKNSRILRSFKRNSKITINQLLNQTKKLCWMATMLFLLFGSETQALMPVKGLAELQDGRLLGVGNDNLLYVLESHFKDWVQVPNSGSVIGVAVMQDGTILGVGQDKQLWTRETLDSNWELIPNSGSVIGVAVMQDGTILGIGLSNQLWTRETLNANWELVPNSGSVIGVTVMKDGSILGIGLSNQLWRRSSLNRNWHHQANSGSVIAVSCMQDGTIVGVGTDQQLWTRSALYSNWAPGPPLKKMPMQELLAMSEARRVYVNIRSNRSDCPAEGYLATGNLIGQNTDPNSKKAQWYLIPTHHGSQFFYIKNRLTEESLCEESTGIGCNSVWELSSSGNNISSGSLRFGNVDYSNRLDKRGVLYNGHCGSSIYSHYDHDNKVSDWSIYLAPEETIENSPAMEEALSMVDMNQTYQITTETTYSSEEWALIDGVWVLISNEIKDSLECYIDTNDRDRISLRQAGNPEGSFFTFEYAQRGYFLIRDFQTNLVLGKDSYRDVISFAQEENGSDGQLWKIEQLADGSFTMKNKANNQALFVIANQHGAFLNFSSTEASKFNFNKKGSFLTAVGTAEKIRTEQLVQNLANAGYSLVTEAVNEIVTLAANKCALVNLEGDRDSDDISGEFSALVCATQIGEDITLETAVFHSECKGTIDTGMGAKCEIGVFATTVGIDTGYGTTTEFELKGPTVSGCGGLSKNMMCANVGADLVSTSFTFKDEHGNGFGAGVGVGVGAGFNGEYEDGVFSFEIEVKAAIGGSVSFSVNPEYVGKKTYKTGETGYLYVEDKIVAVSNPVYNFFKDDIGDNVEVGINTIETEFTSDGVVVNGLESGANWVGSQFKRTFKALKFW